MRFKEKRSHISLKINESDLSQLLLSLRAYYLFLSSMNYCLFLCQLIVIYSILLLGSSTHKFKLLYCSLRSEISISFSFLHFWLQHPGNGSKGILSSSFKSKLSEIMIITKMPTSFQTRAQKNLHCTVCSRTVKALRFYLVCKLTG